MSRSPTEAWRAGPNVPLAPQASPVQRTGTAQRTDTTWLQRLGFRTVPARHVYLSERGAWSFEPGQTDQAGTPWPDFTAWCAAHPGTPVRLWVSAIWLRSLTVPADLPLADEAALRDYARLQFSHYFGPAAAQWPLATWHLPSQHASQHAAQRGACALQPDAGGTASSELQLPALQASARANSVKIMSLRPAWCQALQSAAQRDPVWAGAEHTGLALLEERSLSWLALRAGEVIEVQQRHLDPTNAAELRAQLREIQHELEAVHAPAGGFSHAPCVMGWSTLIGPDEADAGGLLVDPAAALWLCSP